MTYPGGPEIAKLAKDGDSEAYLFPRPMLKKPGLNFSFSGLKTAVMLVVRQAEKAGTIEKNKPDIAASFQKAAIDTLIGRTLKAAKIHNFERVVVAGGVGANIMLRQNLKACFDGSVFYPRHEFCTDNAAMIAVAGAYRLAEAQEVNEIKATARWSLESINT